SVLLDLMSHIFGNYLVHTRFDAFLKKYNNTSTNDLARLSNARTVTANESGVGKNWDEERIKEITGGDRITARFLYGEYFEFQSKIKLWCATNNLPKTDDLSDAFWRRMIVIPFDRQFKGDNCNPNIFSELKRESRGILNRLYKGFQHWTSKTLKNPPPRVINAVNEYKVESDVVAQFVTDCVIENGGYEQTSAKIVFTRYKEWHEHNAIGRPISPQAFGKRMKALGMGSEKIGGIRKYLGLELTNSGP
ncbi:MAG: phage/plasmid primase, P4 family, partial [Dehalococcoidia bacterium]|nr:phage/plasmid primase, P4 family [Dehalococcoidia bacterium]